MSYHIDSDLSALESKYDEHRLPTFDESHAQEALMMERQRLMEATKELGRMKLEMERQIREEMEAKIRAEMEERAQQRKEEDERLALYAERQRAISDVIQKIKNSTRPGLSAFFSTFIQSHTVLYIIGKDIYSYGYWPEIIVTSTMIGYIRSVYNPQKNAYPYHFLPLYHFREPLRSSDLVLLDNGMKYCTDITYGMETLPTSYDIRELAYVSAGNNFDMIPRNLAVLTARQRLQSIIRLIPGGYRNGDWVQLDGFYGMYYHPPTQTFLPHPPPLEE